MFISCLRRYRKKEKNRRNGLVLYNLSIRALILLHVTAYVILESHLLGQPFHDHRQLSTAQVALFLLAIFLKKTFIKRTFYNLYILFLIFPVMIIVLYRTLSTLFIQLSKYISPV